MIGTRIAELRKLKGIKLCDLAEQAEISKSYLSNLENNRKENPSPAVLEKIASVLKVNVSDFFNETPIEDKLSFLEDDMKILFSKAQKLSKSDRQKVLKMIEIFEQENN
ncbi:helix-turn-helix domain-containing protein [Clostridium butyricum]|uniref:HTH-type transcriptional regulator SinR n=1 Tax=Clostridium butyricum E4 str. BoNT E BL5262 TaxID=632245 RepID=C4IGV2_CLOBU|nr:helix-turn-helix transcriptional regulator [Clostridium butyricum]EDT74777.1 HTH-type transcriptional regulator SinR [Clostridium butyricum 5521]EEP53319.1 HTH-type transcriptional regulator SinR [Clostridium butyricum E4 str. BoNT E BL5262]NFL30517.1 helix-turn-helix transcriptional regulator [Clostridium butyricum]NFS19472.1 helix-turn-helix transcriptional regulator [Clostridium butyricum]